jgi:hypothetical protein
VSAPLPRRLATALLESALAIAPNDVREWGQAMLGEVRHVEGNWSALLWSLGGAGVLAKQALIALIFPSARGGTVPSGGDLFSKEARMRKPALVVMASCVVASLLFFLLPVFRQAFQVSLAQWHEIFHINVERGFSRSDDAAIAALAKKAGENRDAEALAFAAGRISNQEETLGLVDEAVSLDPNLVWAYATTGAFYSPNFGMDRMALLQKWDPQNALVYLIAAQRIGETVTFSKEFPHGKATPNEGWDKAMDAAFHAPKLDEYGDRQKQLDLHVLARYHRKDPLEIPAEDWLGFPSYRVSYAIRYSNELLESGQALEDRGDRKGAFEKYLAIAHFCGLTGPAHVPFVQKEFTEAFDRLARLSEMQGDKSAAAFYSALGGALAKNAEQEMARRRSRFHGSEVSHWNAFLVRCSGLALLFCAAVLVACALGVLVRSRSLRWSALHPSRLTLVLGSSAAVGALMASAVLFVSYRPYAELVQRYLSKGDESGLADLSTFVADVQLPVGSQLHVGDWYVGAYGAVFYFWFGVALLCGAALLAAVLRHLQTRQRVAAAG